MSDRDDRNFDSDDESGRAPEEAEPKESDIGTVVPGAPPAPQRQAAPPPPPPPPPGAAWSPPCPPPSNDENGTRAWFTPNYPQQSGQFVDCGLIQFGSNQNAPTYVWTIPSRQTFVRAVASSGTSFAELNTWFNNHALP